jgi:hypothetical protein
MTDREGTYVPTEMKGGVAYIHEPVRQQAPYLMPYSA